MRPILVALLLGLQWAATPASAIQIDGVLDPDEWQDAQHFDAFVSVQPLTGAPAPEDRRAEVWLKSTPEGIAVAMRAWHPPDVPRTRSRIARDGRDAVDRFNVTIDFDADGRAGYDFTITSAGDIKDAVISNESAFRDDWDGAWEHAVGEFDGGYIIEWRIPWTIAQMRDAGAERRTIGVYFDRVIAASGERFAYPEASFTRARFVSDFARIEVDQYRQQQLALTPYAVAIHDRVGAGDDFKVGADLFWKPGGDHQFALTLNPDFGQVESDQLVVNFSAIETFFNDKRPFFTENQSYFDLQHTLGTLFYTRRVGGALDDGTGAAQIRAAIKANGSVGAYGYGAFVAEEDGEAGRRMALVRSTHRSEGLTLGLTRSRVQRPFLDRVADVSAVDARWQPANQWLLRPLLMRSSSDSAGLRREGNAAGVVIDWDLPGPWRQQYFALYADRDFELNDLGFQDRNDFRYFEWETGYRQDHLPDTSAFASHSWELDLIQRENTAGQLLRRSVGVQRYSEFRTGGNLFASLGWRDAVVDDRLSRGNGAVPLEAGPTFFIERSRPRRGDGRLGWYANFEIFPEPVDGYSLYAGFQPRWHVSDRLDVDLGIYGQNRPDWLLWQRGREFGSFKARRIELYSNLNWFIGERQELRVKLQAIAIDAQARKALRLDGAGRLVASTEEVSDFQLRNLGFQIRYRYKLAMLSDFYAVYSRGGFAIDEPTDSGAARGLSGVLDDVFALRDDDQFLLKVAYRFAL